MGGELYTIVSKSKSMPPNFNPTKVSYLSSKPKQLFEHPLAPEPQPQQTTKAQSPSTAARSQPSSADAYVSPPQIHPLSLQTSSASMPETSGAQMTATAVT
jgi:hypothetical protein